MLLNLKATTHCDNSDAEGAMLREKISGGGWKLNDKTAAPQNHAAYGSVASIYLFFR